MRKPRRLLKTPFLALFHRGVALCLALAYAWGCQSTPPPEGNHAQTSLQAADHLFEKGHYAEALRKYEALAKRNPKDRRVASRVHACQVLIHFEAAEEAYQQKQYQRARGEYRAVLEHSPVHAPSREGISRTEEEATSGDLAQAKLLLEGGDSRKALAILEKTRRLDPGNPAVQELFETAKTAEAQRQKKVLQWLDLARQAESKGDWQGALSYIRWILRNEPDNPMAVRVRERVARKLADTHFVRGDELERRNSWIEAEQSYQAALAMLPGWGTAAKALERVKPRADAERELQGFREKMELGYFDEAVENFLKARKSLAKVAGERERLDGFARELDEMLRSDGKNRLEQKDLVGAQKRWEQRMRIKGPAVAEEPEYTAIRQGLDAAEAAYRKARQQQARRYLAAAKKSFEETLAISRPYRDAEKDLSSLEAQLGELARHYQKMEEARQAGRLGESLGLCDTIRAVTLGYADTDKSWTTLRQQKSDAAEQIQDARAAERAGRLEAALAQYREAVRLWPEHEGSVSESLRRIEEQMADAEDLYQQAQGHERVFEWDNALETYQLLVERVRDFRDASQRISWLRQLKAEGAGRLVLEKALQLVRQAEEALSAGRLAEALSALEEAAALRPPNLAEIRRKILSAESAWTAALLEEARSLRMQGDAAGATSKYQAILARLPGHREATEGVRELEALELRQKAKQALAERRVEDALRLLRRARELAPSQRPEIDQELAQAKSGELDSLLERAKVLWTEGRLAEALSLYDEILATFPDHAAARESKAELEKYLGEAARYHQAAAENLRKRRLVSAVSELEQVVEMLPDQKESRAELEAIRKQLEQAAASYIDLQGAMSNRQYEKAFQISRQIRGITRGFEDVDATYDKLRHKRKRAQRELERGQLFERGRRLVQALAHYRGAEEVWPEVEGIAARRARLEQTLAWVEDQVGRAKAAERSGEMPLALKLYREVSQTVADHPVVRSRLPLLEQPRYWRILTDLSRLEQMLSAGEVRKTLEPLRRLQERLGRAPEELQSVIAERAIEWASKASSQAAALQAQGDLEEALELCEQASAVAPSSTEAAMLLRDLRSVQVSLDEQRKLAEAADRQGNLLAAAEAYQKALNIYPGHRKIQDALAKVTARLGDVSAKFASFEAAFRDRQWEKSLALAREIFQAAPGFRDIDGQYRALSQKKSAAERAYQEATAAEKRKELLRAIVLYEEASRNWPELKELEAKTKACQASLKWMEALYADAENWEKEGSLQKALAALQTIAKTTSDFRDVAQKIARMQAAMEDGAGQPSGASADSKEESARGRPSDLELRREEARKHRELGDRAWKQKRLVEAEREFAGALEIWPELKGVGKRHEACLRVLKRAEALYQDALQREQDGQPSEAREIYQRIYAEARDYRDVEQRLRSLADE